MRHAQTLKFELSSPTVHSLYCGGAASRSLIIDNTNRPRVQLLEERAAKQWHSGKFLN